MRVSLNWLCELVPELPRDSARIADLLTSIGLEVEGVTPFGAGLESLRIATVTQVVKHPNRDKLRLVTLSLGSAGEQTVVCGASNVPDPGGQVVLAPLGTHLPAVNMTLTPKDIGGVQSEGMLCSERELGLATESRGIVTFAPNSHPAGAPFLQAFPFATDSIFELGVTPNRPDALGHVGVARDLAARLELALRLPEVIPLPNDPAEVLKRVAVVNQAKEQCPRYGAAIVEGITIAESPAWLRWRLFSLGVRPISNVVDITNLLLLEHGNPMHAFDLERVNGKRIVIRHANAGETMTTLDGKSHALLDSDLVIADAERPSALAGIMGGSDSEIHAETSTVLLECAYFEPTGVRRTARRLGIQTDSSYRFERGVDHGSLERVLARACSLLAELAKGRTVSGSLFVDGARPPAPEVELRSARLDLLLGSKCDFGAATATLERLGFQRLQGDARAAKFRVPTFRPDVSLEADLIEEIARMSGLDRVAAELPRIRPNMPSPVGRLERACRAAASDLGLSEAVTYTFVSRASLETVFAPEPTVVLRNPFSEEREVMATSLLPGLLEAARRAERHGEERVALFGVGSLFLSPLGAVPTGAAQNVKPRDAFDVGRLPEERSAFALILAGLRHAYLERPKPFDVYDAKGLLCELLTRLVGRAPRVEATPASLFHPRASGTFWIENVQVGRFGTLHPNIAEKLELVSTAQIGELDLAALEALEPAVSRYRPIPRLPAITRDVALEAPESLRVGVLEDAILSAAGELCESVELFDVFRPEGSTNRSLAFRLVYRDPNASANPSAARTLTDKEVEAVQAKVFARVAELGATLRA
jgi:phenylalanyl-tRNA synthetase beta chain